MQQETKRLEMVAGFLEEKQDRLFNANQRLEQAEKEVSEAERRLSDTKTEIIGAEEDLIQIKTEGREMKQKTDGRTGGNTAGKFVLKNRYAYPSF